MSEPLRSRVLDSLVSDSRRSELANQIIFDGVEIADSRALDIGAGSGNQSEFLVSRGAEVVALEPMLDGSGAVEQSKLVDLTRRYDNISVERTSFQEYEPAGSPFDVIVMRNCINHLDEDAASEVHRSRSAQEIYSTLFTKLREVTAPGGVLIIRDAAHTDFWRDLGVPNPFSLSIERHTHQPPRVWSTLLARAGFEDPHVEWTGFFAELGEIPRRIFSNKPLSYLTGNVFILRMKRPADDRP